MKTAVAHVDQQDSLPTARHLGRRDAEDSRVRLRAPVPPALPAPEPAAEPEADFIAFLCGRFQVDRERGLALLSTLLADYVPSEPYPIHTLKPQAFDAEDAAG